jgi:small subunit ribosomal protein S6
MPANVYECMFLLDTTKVAGDVPGAVKQLHTILERHQAEILASRPWDERRLAYPIKNHKKGLYYLTYFRTDAKNLVEIDRDCKLNELILRQMVLRIHPKLVDTMLALARDEHALALHGMADEPTEGGDRPGDGDHRESRGPRRGPRPAPEAVAEGAEKQ